MPFTVVITYHIYSGQTWETTREVTRTMFAYDDEELRILIAARGWDARVL